MRRVTLSFILMTIYMFHECYLAKHATDVVLERAELTYVNPKYIYENATTIVKRSSRRGQYSLNLSGQNKQTWANNVTLSIYLRQYLNNEYRPSFVEAHYKYCDFINNDPNGRRLQKYGVVCPMYENNWAISNVTIAFPTFASIFPFTKCKIELVLKVTSPVEEVMGRGNLYVTLKEV